MLMKVSKHPTLLINFIRYGDWVLPPGDFNIFRAKFKLLKVKLFSFPLKIEKLKKKINEMMR